MQITKNLNDHCWLDDTFLTPEAFRDLAEQFGTPLFVYDEKGLRLRAKSLLSLFPEVGGNHYFPVRKCAKEAVLRTVCQCGIGLQCQSLQELDLALAAGCSGEKILYCAVTLTKELALRLKELNASLLAASPAVFRFPLPRSVFLMCWVHRGIGQVKHHAGIGFAPSDLPKAVRRLREAGVQRVGLSMGYDGNVTDETFLSKQLDAALRLAALAAEQGSAVDEVHLDGGLGLLYNRVKMLTMDEALAAKSVTQTLEGRSLPVSMTLGTFLLEPCAVLLTRVLGLQQSDNPVVLVDANTELLHFSTIDRYRHTSIVGKEVISGRRAYAIAGSIPRFSDWFAKMRLLPDVEEDDLMLLHDVGYSMQPNCGAAAVYAREDGSFTAL